MSADTIIFLPSAMCLFTLYTQLGFPTTKGTTPALKVRIWIFGLYYVQTSYVSEKSGNIERKRERDRETERQRMTAGRNPVKAHNWQPLHPGGQSLFFQSFSFLTELQKFWAASKQWFCCFLILLRCKKSKLVRYEYKPDSAEMGSI